VECMVVRQGLFMEAGHAGNEKSVPLKAAFKAPENIFRSLFVGCYTRSGFNNSDDAADLHSIFHINHNIVYYVI
jgi:hypothetical protein